MAGILRGDVVWAELDPTQGHEQSGRRPVVVLSHDVFNERSGTVIACALTSQAPASRISTHARIDRGEAAEAFLGKNQADQNSLRKAAWKETRECFG